MGEKEKEGEEREIKKRKQERERKKERKGRRRERGKRRKEKTHSPAIRPRHHRVNMVCLVVMAVLAVGMAVPQDVELKDVPPSKTEVASLPGWEGELPSKMFTGFIDAGTPPSGKGTMVNISYGVHALSLWVVTLCSLLVRSTFTTG
jgi:hypothetical protein